MKIDGYITQAHLLEKLGMDRSTWHRRCQVGMGIRPVKKGNRNMYPIEDVMKLLQRHRREGKM